MKAKKEKRTMKETKALNRLVMFAVKWDSLGLDVAVLARKKNLSKRMILEEVQKRTIKKLIKVWAAKKEEGKQWLRDHIRFEVQDLATTRGGGYWDPSRDLVFLYTAQY